MEESIEITKQDINKQIHFAIACLNDPDSLLGLSGNKINADWGLAQLAMDVMLAIESLKKAEKHINELQDQNMEQDNDKE